MPEWVQGALAAVGAAIGAWIAIRVELRFVWRDLGRLTRRVQRIEDAAHREARGPHRRWSD